VGARETRESGRREVEREVRSQAKREESSARVASRARVCDSAADRLKCGHRAREEATTGCGEGHAATSADQEWRPELSFEAAQARRERRLRDVERLRGPRDAPPPLRLDESLS
jgi:hypothetical protein